MREADKKALGIALLATAGVVLYRWSRDPLVGWNAAPGSLFGGAAVPPPVTSDPGGWLDWLDRLDDELTAAGVVNFSARELTELRKVKAPYVKPYYAEPPAELWANMVDAARLAQRVRDLYGEPLRAYNGYRPQWYNDAVGGEPGSWHVQAGAVDLTPVSPVTSEKVARLYAAAAQAIEELGPDIGGLGIYSTAVHVDIGPKRTWT